MSIETLQRRAATAPGWRWMAGMRYRLTPRHPWMRYEGSDAADDDGHPVVESMPTLRSASVEPDLTDPATLGCLLALVREQWGATAHIVRFNTNVDDGEGGTKPACWWALAVGLESRPLARYHTDGSCRYIAAPTEAEVCLRACGLPPIP